MDKYLILINRLNTIFQIEDFHQHKKKSFFLFILFLIKDLNPNQEVLFY